MRLQLALSTSAAAVLAHTGVATFYADAARAQEQKYQTEVLQQEDVGTLQGKRTMRIVLLTMEPGAEIPEHQHAGPGLRYVLDGEITIALKDGEEKTYKAGEPILKGQMRTIRPG